jgi:hypothetical protein
MTEKEEAAVSARIMRITEIYRCSREDAWRFIELREEGCGQYQAAVLAGIADPEELA